MISRRAVGVTLESLTPRAFREAVDEGFGPALERWATRMGLTHTQHAEEMDVTRQTLDQYLRGPAKPKGVRSTVGFLYAQPLVLRVLAAQDLIGDDYTIVELPRAENGKRPNRRWLTAILRGGTEALTKAVDHGDDDRFTRAEAAELVPMVENLVRELVRLLEILREAERTGVVCLESVHESAGRSLS
jgi:hypothetical protein